jgi:hypothetical protein
VLTPRLSLDFFIKADTIKSREIRVHCRKTTLPMSLIQAVKIRVMGFSGINIAARSF